MVREALSAAVRSVWPGVHADEADTLAAIEDRIASRKIYDLVTLDLGLPDAAGFSGLMLVRKLLPHAPVAVITSREDGQAAATAHLLGAAAYLSKSAGLTEIADALKRVAAGERVFPPAEAAATAITPGARARLDSLSPAQLRILLALADGRLNKQIAGDMGLTEATVKAHLTAIFKKMGVTNRTQAILVAQPLLAANGR